MTYLNPKITPTRRRVRMSKYIAQVNTVGANVGAKLLYFNFIYIKQLLSTVMWRTDRDSKIIDLIPLISLYIYLYDLNSSVNSSVTMRF